MNTQPIEKLNHTTDGSLEIHSVFYTIQGEGPFTGRPAIFVRLAGCNLQCPACDTDYTSIRRVYHVNHLLDEIMELRDDDLMVGAPNPIVVITGGEPFRQDITRFANTLVYAGWTVQVESNGTLPPSEDLDKRVVIVVSPKTGKLNPKIEERVNALKYIVKAGCIDRSDGLPIRSLDHTASPTVAKPPPRFTGPIYIQPMDDGTIRGLRDNSAAAVTACKKYGHILQIQTHKILGIE